MEANNLFENHTQNSGRHLKTQVPAVCCHMLGILILKFGGKRRAIAEVI